MISYFLSIGILKRFGVSILFDFDGSRNIVVLVGIFSIMIDFRGKGIDFYNAYGKEDY